MGVRVAKWAARLGCAVALGLTGIAVAAAYAPVAPRAAAADTGRPANDSDCFYNLTFSRAARIPPQKHARRIFARHNIWNTRIRKRARVDPGSRVMAAQLLSEVRDQYRRGVGPWLDRGPYSTPLYKVGKRQKLVRVALDFPSNACRFSLARAFAQVPLPRRARPASGTDHHLTLWQPSTDKLWEFWHLRREADGWHAGFGGAIAGVSRSPGRYTADSWPGVHTDWGATASGLPVIGGVMTPKELRRHRIRHALALNLPLARKGVAALPALKTDGDGEGAGYIPEGARLRLDPKLDISKLDLPPLVRAMAKAAQRYGIYVRDQTRAGATFFAQTKPGGYSGRSDPLRGQLPHKVLIKFPWAHLQVMRIRSHPLPHYTYPQRTIKADGSPAGS